jgi:hypothetical protein
LPARVKWRFALLTLGRLLMGSASLYRAVEIFKAGDSSILLLVFLIFGLALLWWGVVGALALLRSNTETDEPLIASAITDVDRRAPSGTRPLWIALAAILSAFVIWILIANLVGA